MVGLYTIVPKKLKTMSSWFSYYVFLVLVFHKKEILSNLRSTLTPRVCKVMAFRALIMGLGLILTLTLNPKLFLGLRCY